MADKENAPELYETEAVKKLNRKARRRRPTFRKFMTAILAALVIGGGAYIALGGNVNQLVSFAKGQVGTIVPQSTQAASYYLAMPTVTVNLIENNGQDAFLKVAPILEFSDKGMNEIISERRPRIMDSFTSLMRNLRISDIKGSAGTQMLREELTKRANVALHPYKVNTVRFKEIIIQ